MSNRQRLRRWRGMAVPASVLIGLLAWGSLADARVVEETGQEIPVRAAPGQTTEVVFSEAISQVVTSLGKEVLSLETTGPRLYLSPLAPSVEGTVFVVLQSERSVPLAIVPATTEAPRDVSVRILSPTRPTEASRAPLPELTPLGLLRAILLGTELPGVETTTTARQVYDDQAVRLTLQQVWRAPQLEGDVLLAENLRAIWIRLPLERIHFPGLLAIHAKSEFLAPQPTTPEEQLAGRYQTHLYLIRVP